MLRDYVLLVFDDKWYWCHHCRRPVEHIVVDGDDASPCTLACLDCGNADPETLRVWHRPSTSA